jgi:hypothetical protein
MNFFPRQGARRRHGNAMATKSNAAFGEKGAEIVQVNYRTPH